MPLVNNVLSTTLADLMTLALFFASKGNNPASCETTGLFGDTQLLFKSQTGPGMYHYVWDFVAADTMETDCGGGSAALDHSLRIERVRGLRVSAGAARGHEAPCPPITDS